MSEINELRMYLIVRGDIEMPLGKAMGQAGHAFSTVLINTDKDLVRKYYDDNQTKIVLKCKNLLSLERAHEECLNLNLPCFLVTDAGRTIFPEPTKTCMAIGPCYKTDLPKFIQKMQLL